MRGHETFDNAIGVGIGLCCAIPVLGHSVIILCARHSNGLLAVWTVKVVACLSPILTVNVVRHDSYELSGAKQWC